MNGHSSITQHNPNRVPAVCRHASEPFPDSDADAEAASLQGHSESRAVPWHHLGEPSRALGTASIRGPPNADDYWEAIVDSDNDRLDPASQVIPDYESQRQDLSW